MIKLLTEDSLSNKFFVVQEGKIVINPVFQEEFGDRLDTVESRIQAMLGLATEVSQLKEQLSGFATEFDIISRTSPLQDQLTYLQDFEVAELKRKVQTLEGNLSSHSPSGSNEELTEQVRALTEDITSLANRVKELERK